MTGSRLGAGALVAILCTPGIATAGGFEVGSNTALSNGRGGTGLVSKLDPSATTINPGRLPFVRGFQVIIGSNLVDLNVKFQRDPLVRRVDTQEFEEVRNVSPPFPVPYLAASWDLGIENLAVGVSLSGPHAYGSRCFSEIVDGECVVDFSNAARHMVVTTQLLEIFFLATVGYAFEMDAGKLGVGLSGGPAYQDNDLTLVVDQVGLVVGPPYTENPDFQGAFRATDMRDVQPVFLGGLSWEGVNGVRFGVAYQTGISWNAKGRVEVDFPDAISELIELTDDGLLLRTKQAHRLSGGWGYAAGAHPGVKDAPLFDVEANIIWEDWSRVAAFETEPIGSILVTDTGDELPLNPVIQPKGYQDTFALRVGGSYGATRWLTLHAGGFVETAAQREAVTNADFVSWERYSGSGGATLHLVDWLDVTMSYAFVGSPSRNVKDGAVYSQIPLSRCTYPNFDQEACAEPGTPPGNPQNNGDWSSHFHIAGLNLTAKF